MPRIRGPYRIQRHAVIQPLDASYRLIPLTQNQNAIVDAKDFDWLSKWNWHAHWSDDPKTFYAERNKTHADKGSHSIRKMHREIMGCKKGEECDHENHNGLDNRRTNLRKCTQTENRSNKKRYKNNTSGFKGVWLYPNGKWLARIQKNGKCIRLGYFFSKEEAARSYDEAAKIHHGKFAKLNFA